MIGILGGFGTVGREVARLLHAWGETSLRLGGRHPEPLSWAQSCYVDVQDADSLRRFCTGCQLIINCAAPSCRFSAEIAQTLMREAIPLIDAGGVNCPEQLALSATASTALFAAGALPGLSGLLPLWLAGTFDSVNSLHCWFSVLDRFTQNGAEDYLDGILNTETAAATSRRQYNVSLPFLPRPVTLQAYQDAESRWVQSQLGLSHSQCFLALDGEHLARALDKVRALDRSQAIKEIVRGSRLDTAGRQPNVTFIVQIDGVIQAKRATRTLVLRAPGIATLTAACAAASAQILVKSTTPTIGLAAQSLDPQELILLFYREPAGINIEVFDVAMSALNETTGGAI